MHAFLREFDVRKFLVCEGRAGLGGKDGGTGEGGRSWYTGSLFPYELEETSVDVEDGRNDVVDNVGPDNDDSLIALQDDERGKENPIERGELLTIKAARCSFSAAPRSKMESRTWILFFASTAKLVSSGPLQRGG